jgi:hypothetical protein
MARVGGGPLSASTGWVALPTGGVAIIHPNPYRVDVIDPSGRVARGTPVPFTPIRVTAAERQAERERRASQPGMTVSIGGGSGSGNVRTIGTGSANRSGQPELADSEFPATMGPFIGTGAPQVSPSGEIWVLRARPASDKVPTYDIFSPAGRLVGKATLRPNSQVVGFGRGVVYVARQDPEDDLRYVEQYPLR